MRRLLLALLLTALLGLLIWFATRTALDVLRDADAPRGGALSRKDSIESLRRQCREVLERCVKEQKGRPMTAWPEETRRLYEIARKWLEDLD